MLITKSVVYALKTLLGASLCWYGLTLLGLPDPIWAVITVIIVTDPDLKTTTLLARVRAINTAVGCFFGLLSLLLFGYVPWITLVTAAVTVLVVNLIENYPTNWRLAPVTVVILMDAGRQASTQHEVMSFAFMRLVEIAIGCAVALILARLYTQFVAPRMSISNKAA